MRLIFVRHGDANYERDCLTELGHAQAEAAATRLLDERIDRIFSSTCGRAVETARHIAEKQGLGIEESYDFMREISWGSIAEESRTHTPCDEQFLRLSPDLVLQDRHLASTRFD